MSMLMWLNSLTLPKIWKVCLFVSRSASSSFVVFECIHNIKHKINIYYLLYYSSLTNTPHQAFVLVIQFRMTVHLNLPESCLDDHLIMYLTIRRKCTCWIANMKEPPSLVRLHLASSEIFFFFSVCFRMSPLYFSTWTLRPWGSIFIWKSQIPHFAHFLKNENMLRQKDKWWLVQFHSELAYLFAHQFLVYTVVDLK